MQYFIDSKKEYLSLNFSKIIFFLNKNVYINYIETYYGKNRTLHNTKECEITLNSELDC